MMSRTLNKKIAYYHDRIVQENNKLVLAKKYKNNYYNLKNKYKYLTYKKEDILKKVDEFSNKENLIVEKMYPETRGSELYLRVIIKGVFEDISNFLLEISQIDNFSEMKHFIIKPDKSGSDTLTVDLKMIFFLEGYFSQKNSFSVEIKDIAGPGKPFFRKDKREDVMLKKRKEKLKINLPIVLLGIIGKEDNRLAIIRSEEKIKIVDKNYKNEDIKFVKIFSDRIKLKYKELIFMVGIGGNKGVMF